MDGFLASLGKREGKPLTALVARDVDAFLDARLKQGVSPSTACLDVRILRTALNAARRKGLMPTNPAEAVELPDVESVERGTFTPAEVRMLVDAAQGEWKTLILLAYFTGARLGDCCRVAWEDVDLVGGSLAYTQAKTGLKLTVPLHPELLARFETLAGTDTPSPFVLPGMAEKKPGGRKGLSESFKVIVRRAGLDLQTVQGGAAHGRFPAAPSTPSATVSRARWRTRALRSGTADEAHRPQERSHPRGLHAPRACNPPRRRRQAPRPERQGVNTSKPH